MKTIHWFAFATLLASQMVPVGAVQLENGSGTLLIYQRQGLWKLESNGEVVASGRDLERAIEVSVERNEVLSIVVADQNPLLYTYAQETVATESSDFAAASSFATALAKLVGVWSPTGGASVKPIGGSAPTSADEVLENIAKIRAVFHELQEALNSVPRLLVSSASTTPGVVQKAQEEVAGWGIPAKKKTLKETWENLSALMKKLDLANAADKDALLEILRFQDERVTGEKAIDTLSSFSQLMAKVDYPLPLAALEFDAKSRRVVKIKVEVVASNAQLAPSLSPKAQTIRIGVEPYSPVRLGFGGGLLYSFVDDPTFTAQAVDGGYKIVKKSGEDDFVGQKVAAILTLTPRRWSRGSLSGEFHLGVNPEKDHVGLFLGGGIRFADRFSFGAGFTMQEVEGLSEGLSPNDVLESADQLKLKPRYESGFYLALVATTK